MDPAPPPGFAGPASRQQQRKARTSGSIFEAARERFLAQGFHRTTVEEIALDAEVSVGSSLAPGPHPWQQR